jgi:glyoxylate reductase
MSQPLILVTQPIPENGIARLRTVGKVKILGKPGVTPLRTVLRAEAKKADALVTLLTDKIDANFLKGAPQLKVIANYAVGFDNIDIATARELGIPVTNTPGALTDSVAEMTVALTLALAKRLVEADKFVRARKYKGWRPDIFIGTQITGKTLGLVGCGRIGKSVARMLGKGMGMKVVYYDIHRLSNEDEKELGLTFMPLPEVLAQADVISVHVNLTPETHHLIGVKELKTLKKTALLINTSRGPVIDERALVIALKNKKIAGAGLDVFEFEPKLSAGLTKLENVILTPHIASATTEARSQMAELVADNVIAALNGVIPPHKVN